MVQYSFYVNGLSILWGEVEFSQIYHHLCAHHVQRRALKFQELPLKGNNYCVFLQRFSRIVVLSSV